MTPTDIFLKYVGHLRREDVQQFHDDLFGMTQEMESNAYERLFIEFATKRGVVTINPGEIIFSPVGVNPVFYGAMITYPECIGRRSADWKSMFDTVFAMALRQMK